MNTTDSNYLQKLFIDEARPALDRHSMNGDAQEAYTRGYNSGYNKGHTEGTDAGYTSGLTAGTEQGKTEAYNEIQALNEELEQTLYGTGSGGKSYYDEFWDIYQEKGSRQDYSSAFAGVGWNEKTFIPKYDITVKTNAYAIFNLFSGAINLPEHLDKCGVSLKFEATNITSAFYNSKFTNLGTIDFSKVTGVNATGVFDTAINLISVKVILPEGQSTFSNWFRKCSKLVDLIIEGIIDADNFNVQWSTLLTHDSLMSIINALKDFSGTDTWKTITLGSENIAKLTTEELDLMTQKQWNYG